MILQTRIPYDVMTPPDLPGVRPTTLDDWLIVDDAYAAQMAERQRLLAAQPGDVLQLSEAALPAAQECLSLACAHLPEGFSRNGACVTCPDGREVALDTARPLHTLNALFQEDFCLMEKPQGSAEHVLTGAVLCFPASWRLDEKFMRPLIGIHAPVPEYTADIARRVQRLFDGVQVGRPLWRFNVLSYADAALHQPRSRQAPRPPLEPGDAAFLRSERQTILRLPETGAVVFSIHTFIVKHPLQEAPKDWCKPASSP